jgi:hypothetical protein
MLNFLVDFTMSSMYMSIFFLLHQIDIRFCYLWFMFLLCFLSSQVSRQEETLNFCI